MTTTPIADPIEAFAQATGRRRRGRPEVWAWVAFTLLAVEVALVLYLGLRPGGAGPVLAYSYGPPLLGVVAVATAFFGLLWSVLHRPLFRRRRLPAFLCLTVVIGTANYPFPYPSSHEGRPSQVEFRLPVEGEWTVYWGGESKNTNRLAGFVPERRWGLDLVVVRDGRSHEGDGLALEDYYCYDREVLSPAAGRVVDVHSGQRDTQPGMVERGLEAYGNYVVIEVAPDEFLFLAHLKPGSIEVHEDELVEQGQRIGRVGNSGYSPLTPEPHLALHLQDTPVPRHGEPIPWTFHHYLADDLTVAQGLPRGGIGREGAFYGQRVSPLPD